MDEPAHRHIASSKLRLLVFVMDGMVVGTKPHCTLRPLNRARLWL